MIAKEWKERFESLEHSVETLMDDKEMRSGSSVVISILLVVGCWLLIDALGTRPEEREAANLANAAS